MALVGVILLLPGRIASVRLVVRSGAPLCFLCDKLVMGLPFRRNFSLQGIAPCQAALTGRITITKFLLPLTTRSMGPRHLDAAWMSSFLVRMRLAAITALTSRELRDYDQKNWRSWAIAGYEWSSSAVRLLEWPSHYRQQREGQRLRSISSELSRDHAAPTFDSASETRNNFVKRTTNRHSGKANHVHRI